MLVLTEFIVIDKSEKLLVNRISATEVQNQYTDKILPSRDLYKKVIRGLQKLEEPFVATVQLTNLGPILDTLVRQCVQKLEACKFFNSFQKKKQGYKLQKRKAQRAVYCVQKKVKKIKRAQFSKNSYFLQKEKEAKRVKAAAEEAKRKKERKEIDKVVKIAQAALNAVES